MEEGAQHRLLYTLLPHTSLISSLLFHTRSSLLSSLTHMDTHQRAALRDTAQALPRLPATTLPHFQWYATAEAKLCSMAFVLGLFLAHGFRSPTPLFHV
jgi:hypothetical protein